MPQWAKYAIAFAIGYWVASVGGFYPAIHNISVFLGSLGH